MKSQWNSLAHQSKLEVGRKQSDSDLEQFALFHQTEMELEQQAIFIKSAVKHCWSMNADQTKPRLILNTAETLGQIFRHCQCVQSGASGWQNESVF